MPNSNLTLAQLRIKAKAAYARGHGNKQLKGYSRMPKEKLAALLGYRVAAKTRFEHKRTSDRIAAMTGVAERLGGREAVLKLVKSAVDKTRKRAAKEGREATQQELRAAAFAAVRERARHLKETQSATVKRLPSGIAEVPVAELHADPGRFQYKLVHGSSGASGSLTGVRKWDPNLAGIIQVWRDPKDGKDYVINGHNRAELAKRLGAKDVVVRYLDVKSPAEARAVGALTNIAEGRGNALDAAKFFRDSGLTREEVEAKGIPMREKIATDGIALANLSPPLFDKVVHGDLPSERAVIIGQTLKDHEDQSKLVDLIDQEAKKGRKINNDTVRELGEIVSSAPKHSEQQFSLFGTEETTRNLALEKAQLQASIRQKLSREKKLFGLVSKSRTAKELEKAGNLIDVEQSKGISQNAAMVMGVFDQLKNAHGPVSKIINEGVERIANGEHSKTVESEVYRRLTDELPHALGLGKRKSA